MQAKQVSRAFIPPCNLCLYSERGRSNALGPVINALYLLSFAELDRNPSVLFEYQIVLS